MEIHLKKAKYLLGVLNKKSSNAELVLSEIIKTCNGINGVSTASLFKAIPKELEISDSLYRKTISELYKVVAIKKVGTYVYVNTNHIKL